MVVPAALRVLRLKPNRKVRRVGTCCLRWWWLSTVAALLGSCCGSPRRSRLVPWPGPAPAACLAFKLAAAHLPLFLPSPTCAVLHRQALVSRVWLEVKGDCRDARGQAQGQERRVLRGQEEVDCALACWPLGAVGGAAEGKKGKGGDGEGCVGFTPLVSPRLARVRARRRCAARGDG